MVGILLAEEPNRGPDYGKASPVGLLVLLLLLVGVFFLWRSMGRQIKKVPASFDPPGVEAAESPEAASPPGGPAATDADPVAVESEPSAAPEAGTDPDSEAAPRGTGG